MRGEGDIVAAIATPVGRGGIGIVRVSGPDLKQFAQAILGTLPAPRRAGRFSFLDEAGEPLDDGIALYFPGPHSYTGEDVLELQGHGGPTVMRMLLHRCVRLGARAAEPGEFTRRAFENGRMDLAQAEGVADLIEASTDEAVRSALRSLRGEFSALIREFETELVEMRMFIEATLDFPEEDVDQADRTKVSERLDSLRISINSALVRARQGSLLRTGLQVVLAGQPNVGKSSLLNRLAGEELAIVTAVPGTTRDTIREALSIDGVPVNIVDTAGLRETEDEVEVAGIRRTWLAIGEADLLLLLVDARSGISPGDSAILGALPPALPRLIVFNKIDLSGVEPGREMAEKVERIYLSAKTGEGIDLLRAALLDAAGWQSGIEGVFMARERHVAALERTGEILERASAELGRVELLAEELRLAHVSLGSITGEFTADDLLGEIFSRFCIGK